MLFKDVLNHIKESFIEKGIDLVENTIDQKELTEKVHSLCDEKFSHFDKMPVKDLYDIYGIQGWFDTDGIKLLTKYFSTFDFKERRTIKENFIDEIIRISKAETTSSRMSIQNIITSLFYCFEEYCFNKLNDTDKYIVAKLSDDIHVEGQKTRELLDKREARRDNQHNEIIQLINSISDKIIGNDIDSDIEISPLQPDNSSATNTNTLEEITRLKTRIDELILKICDYADILEYIYENDPNYLSSLDSDASRRFLQEKKEEEEYEWWENYARIAQDQW